jgi:hypothetical protein
VLGGGSWAGTWDLARGRGDSAHFAFVQIGTGAGFAVRQGHMTHGNEGCLPCVFEQGARQTHVKFNFCVCINGKFKFS